MIEIEFRKECALCGRVINREFIENPDNYRDKKIIIIHGICRQCRKKNQIIRSTKMNQITNINTNKYGEIIGLYNNRKVKYTFSTCMWFYDDNTNDGYINPPYEYPERKTEGGSHG